MTEPLIADVSDTAFWVAHYRAKENNRPDALFNDPYAESLAGERGRRIADSMQAMGRYTGWSVVSRTVIIDRVIGRWVARQGIGADGANVAVDAVINLGAGLDSRPYRLDLPRELEWIEADHPSIIEHKSRVLANEQARCRLTRVAIDLADGDKRRDFLRAAAPQAKRVLVLTEGVIPYLSPEQVAELAHDLLQEPRFTYWITEYFNPRIYPHLKRAVRTQLMRNAPFRFYPEDWFGFFAQHGWVAQETRYSGEIAVEFGRPMPMPWWARVLVRFMPPQMREQALKASGYTVLKRG